MSLRSYAIRRFLYIFPTLIGISMISFALIAASPGDPIQIRMGLFKGETNEYLTRYNEIGMEIGLLQKSGEDFVSYEISMSNSGFSLDNISVPGPGSANVEHTTVKFLLSSDIQRNFTIEGYEISVIVEANVETELTFQANISSFGANSELTHIFTFSATDVSTTGNLYIEETQYERINVFVRYLQWLGLTKRYVYENNDYERSGLLQGDLGRSWHWTESGIQGKKITQIIQSRLWYTLFLTTPAFIIATILATVIGVIQATRQYSLWDKGVTLASLIGFSMPAFWLAKLVMLGSFFMFNFTGATQGDAFKEPFILNPQFYVFLILPTITLVLTGLVFLSRLTRSQLLDILRQDYIITARAKGLSDRKVTYKHAFRNAMLPIVTVVGLALPGLLGGSVMIEGVFGWPGLGSVFLTSALQRDHPMMMATNFIFGGMFLGFRVLVDLSYALVDPRVRY